MKNLIFGLAATALISGNAFALQTTRCSNADGSLKRTEQEVWGANIIAWTYKGVELPQAKEKFDSQKNLAVSGSKAAPKGETIVFTGKVNLSFANTAIDGADLATVSDYVICSAWSNNARD